MADSALKKGENVHLTPKKTKKEFFNMWFFQDWGLRRRKKQYLPLEDTAVVIQEGKSKKGHLRKGAKRM